MENKIISKKKALEWVALIVVLIVWTSAVFLAGYFQPRREANVQPAKTCSFESVFGDIKTNVEYEKSDEIYGIMGTVLEKGDNTLKISYQKDPINLSGGPMPERKEITVRKDASTKIEKEESLPNGDENISPIEFGSLSAGNIVLAFSNSDISQIEDEFTASKIKLLK